MHHAFAIDLRPLLRLAPVATALVAALATAPAARGERVTVERRGGADAVTGDVLGVDEDALRVRSDSGATYELSWDRVRDVRPASARVQALLQPAEDLWRARIRVERGDTELAEPLLQRLFETYQGRTSETALVVAEGLLRCRTARGDVAGAVVPALETARLRGAGIATDAYALLPEAIDPDTRLSPLVPPVVPAGASRERLERDLAGWRTSDPELAAIAALYGAGAALRPDGAVDPPSSIPAESADPAVRRSEGVALLRRLLEAVAGEPEAIDALDRVRAGAGWRAAWASFFVGAGELRGAAPEAVPLAVVHLLEVPAAHGTTQPWLAGASLFVAETAMRRAGDDGTAEVLRRERRNAYPNHPLNARDRFARRNDADRARVVLSLETR